MENRPVWLDEYADILDEIRNKLKQLIVVEETTLKYAIIRIAPNRTKKRKQIGIQIDSSEYSVINAGTKKKAEQIAPTIGKNLLR